MNTSALTNGFTITTNNQPRDIIYGWQLSEKEQAEFDWMGKEELESACFFKYRGQVYALSEFMVLDDPALVKKGWQGYQSESFFSSVLVKYSEDFEQVTVGLLLS